MIQLIRVKDDRFDLTDELLVPDDFIRRVRTVSALNLYGLKTNVLYNPLVNVAASLLRLPMVPRWRRMISFVRRAVLKTSAVKPVCAIRTRVLESKQQQFPSFFFIPLQFLHFRESQRRR